MKRSFGAFLAGCIIALCSMSPAVAMSKPRQPIDPPAPTGRQFVYGYQVGNIYCNVYRIVGTATLVEVCYNVKTDEPVNPPEVKKPDAKLLAPSKPVIISIPAKSKPVVIRSGNAILA